MEDVWALKRNVSEKVTVGVDDEVEVVGVVFDEADGVRVAEIPCSTASYEPVMICIVRGVLGADVVEASVVASDASTLDSGRTSLLVRPCCVSVPLIVVAVFLGGLLFLTLLFLMVEACSIPFAGFFNMDLTGTDVLTSTCPLVLVTLPLTPLLSAALDAAWWLPSLLRLAISSRSAHGNFQMALPVLILAVRDDFQALK